MQNKSFKTLIIGLALCLTGSLNANAGDAIRWKGGKKYYEHKVQAQETMYRLGVNYNVSQEELIKANPQLKKGLKSGLLVLIPAKDGAKAAKTAKTAVAASKASPTPAKTKWQAKTAPSKAAKVQLVNHKVTDGETMYSIAKKYNTTVADIKEMNYKQVKAGVKKGMVLNIAKNSADGPISNWAKQTAQKKDAQAAAHNTAAKATANNTAGVHTVKKGETLYSISKKYNVSVDAVEKLNPGVKKNGVDAGNKLRMPKSNRYAWKKGTPAKVAAGSRVHKVQKKETVFSISQKYNVNASELIRVNHLKGGLKAGQTVSLPASAQQKTKTGVKTAYQKKWTAPAKSKNVAHTVKPGETMFSLSKTYHVTESELKQENPELKNGLKTGSILFIPRANEVKHSYGGNYFVTTQGNNKVKAALILPLELKNGAIDKNTDKFLEFYEGALIAIKNLKKKGVSVTLYTYNSGKSEEDLNEVLQNSELKNVDFIIGPAYKSQFDPLSAYCKKHDIKMVVPFSNRTEELRNNQNMFLVNAPVSKKAWATGYALEPELRGKNVIVLSFSSDRYNTEQETADSIRAILKRHGTEVKTAVFESTSQLSGLMESGKENVLITTSDNQVAMSQLLPSINAVAKKHDVSVFGYTDWLKYLSLSKDLFMTNTYMATQFDIDYKSWTAKAFLNDFRKYYDDEPDNTIPMYGALGYDVMTYFGQCVASYGRNFEKGLHSVDANTMQTNFNFRRYNETGGFFNGAISISKNNASEGHKIIEE